MAQSNGFNDRMICIQDLSTNISLPQRADVIISDLTGLLPFFGRHIPAIKDARNRFLKPTGSMIPQRDYLHAAIVEVPVFFDKLAKPWSDNLYGLDLSSGWSLVANTWRSLSDRDVRLLTQPADLAVIDYRTIEDSDLDSEISCTVSRFGVAHGIAVWFDRTVREGIIVSNAPDAPDEINVSDIYGQGFFPLQRPVQLCPGDKIFVEIKANLVGEQYVWRWNTLIRAEGGTKARFQQSSLNSHPLSLGSLTKREAEYIPAPNEDACVDAFILSRMDGYTSLRQIALDVIEKFQGRFIHWENALSRVGDVTSRYLAKGVPR
jgi:protein arginine N-methyltransferase 1